MKRLARILAIIISAAGLLAASAALAATNHSGRLVTLPQSQTVNHDYFAAGSNVEIDGTVNGDVYVAGGEVVINGTVNGDVLAAGGIVTVAGTVRGNVRTVGGTIEVNGHITRNLSAAGGDIALNRGADLGGSIAVAGGSLLIDTPVAGDANVAVSAVTLDNTIHGSLAGAINTLNVGSSGHINGSLTYWSRQQLNLPSGTVSGPVTHHVTAQPQPQYSYAAHAALVLYWAVVALIVGALFLWLAPVFTASVTATVYRRPWASLGWGLLGVIATPVIAFLLLLTGVGVPLGVVVGVIFGILVVLAPLWVMITIGHLVVHRGFNNDNRYLALVVGIVIYSVVELIPVLGTLLTILSVLAGLGAIGQVKLGLYRQLRKQKAI